MPLFMLLQTPRALHLEAKVLASENVHRELAEQLLETAIQHSPNMLEAAFLLVGCLCCVYYVHTHNI